MPTDPKGPHSRACGAPLHEHGKACHSNCPTCEGRDLPQHDGHGPLRCHIGCPGWASMVAERDEQMKPGEPPAVVLTSQEAVQQYDYLVLASFAQWVASNRAYNGAPDPGQSLYNDQINAVLLTWAKEFLDDRPTGGKHRAPAAGDWPEGDDRLCTMLSCSDNQPHTHGGATVFMGHRRYRSGWNQ